MVNLFQGETFTKSITIYFMKYPSLKRKDLTSIALTHDLVRVKKHLEEEMVQGNCSFDKNAKSFSTSVWYFFYRESKSPALVFMNAFSANYRKNKKLLKDINDQLLQKKSLIQDQFKDDIKIVDDFLQFAEGRLMTRELYFVADDFVNESWLKISFKQNVANYLTYKYRMDATSLNDVYLKGFLQKFAIHSFGLTDRRKVQKANQYFKLSQNPFERPVPERFKDVKMEVQMGLPLMMASSRFLDTTVSEIIDQST